MEGPVGTKAESRSDPRGVICSAAGGRRRRSQGQRDKFDDEALAKRLEDLVHQLFRVHDLNSNGLLEEHELVTLNEKIALLHRGVDADTQEVAVKYRELFRTEL